MYQGCGLYDSEVGGWNPIGVMNYDDLNYTRKPRRFGRHMGQTYEISLEELARTDPNFPHYSVSRNGKVIKTDEIVQYLVERIEDAWALQKQPKPRGVDARQYSQVKANYKKIATALMKLLPKETRGHLKRVRAELKHYNKVANNNQQRWDRFVNNPDRDAGAWKYLYNLENVDLDQYPQYQPPRREMSSGFRAYLDFARQFRQANSAQYPKGVVPRAVLNNAWNSIKNAQGIFRQRGFPRRHPTAADQAGPARRQLPDLEADIDDPMDLNI